MRTFGLLLLVGGIFGFIYFGGQLSNVEPLPAGEGLTVTEMLHTPAGRLEGARDTCAFAGAVGLLLIFLGKSR
jgi:hypothetical protein